MSQPSEGTCHVGTHMHELALLQNVLCALWTVEYGSCVTIHSNHVQEVLGATQDNL
jgi:hypothetical protein